jgi:ribonuclease P protein component
VKEQDDVGNNSTKKQSQAEALTGIPEAHEHSQGQGSNQPAQSQGKKAPRSVTRTAGYCMPYAYRKSERIRKNSEFVSVMKGKRLSIDGLSLFYTRNETANFRVGISVSKRLANAVARNRLKRRMRACIMQALKDHACGYDLVFVARKELYSADHARILKAVQQVLQGTVLRKPSQGALS